jgi:hypothetical protein
MEHDILWYYEENSHSVPTTPKVPPITQPAMLAPGFSRH